MDFLGFFFFMDLFFWSIIFQKTVFYIIFNQKRKKEKLELQMCHLTHPNKVDLKCKALSSHHDTVTTPLVYDWCTGRTHTAHSYVNQSYVNHSKRTWS